MPDVSASVPPSLLMVAERVEARFDALLSAEVARWRALSPDLEPPLDSLRSLVMNGGKRLRPAFCFWAYCGAGGYPESPAVIDTGAAFEMPPPFALVHDDGVDRSYTRPGAAPATMPTGAHHGTDP